MIIIVMLPAELMRNPSRLPPISGPVGDQRPFLKITISGIQRISQKSDFAVEMSWISIHSVQHLNIRNGISEEICLNCAREFQCCKIFIEHF